MGVSLSAAARSADALVNDKLTPNCQQIVFWRINQGDKAFSSIEKIKLICVFCVCAWSAPASEASGWRNGDSRSAS